MALFKKKIRTVVKVNIDNQPEIRDFPSGLRIPNIGEYLWLDTWNKGTVLSIKNELHDKLYYTEIRIGETNNP